MLPVNRDTNVANQSSVYTPLCKTRTAYWHEHLIHHFNSRNLNGEKNDWISISTTFPLLLWNFSTSSFTASFLPKPERSIFDYWCSWKYICLFEFPRDLLWTSLRESRWVTVHCSWRRSYERQGWNLTFISITSQQKNWRANAIRQIKKLVWVWHVPTPSEAVGRVPHQRLKFSQRLGGTG